MGEKSRKGTGFDKETQATIGKHFAALVDHAKEKEGLTALEAYKQIYGDDDNEYKENKISSMKSGTGITAYDVMKIQSWKNLSLDWLMLGNGNPPPELQEKKKERSDDIESAPSYTVRGFISSLMFLSLAKYVHDLKIKLSQKHDPVYQNYFYHKVDISFALMPFEGHGYFYDFYDNSRCYNCDFHECDSTLNLIYGLRQLSDSNCKLLELPNKDPILLDAKIRKYREILNFIPPWQELTDYDTCPF